VVEAGGERWQMSLDRHGRLYVPSRLRPMFEEAKTIMVRREDDTLSSSCFLISKKSYRLSLSDTWVSVYHRTAEGVKTPWAAGRRLDF
jgi:hypothetical protein